MPVYNPNSGLVTWTVGSLSATKGVLGEPVEAIFQIEATPAVNQEGENILLLGETKIEGVDTFTGILLQDLAPSLNSSLPHDMTITVQDRRVQP